MFDCSRLFFKATTVATARPHREQASLLQGARGWKKAIKNPEGKPSGFFVLRLSG